MEDTSRVTIESTAPNARHPGTKVDVYFIRWNGSRSRIILPAGLAELLNAGDELAFEDLVEASRGR